MARIVKKSRIGLINSWLMCLKLPLHISQNKRADPRSNVPIFPLYKNQLLNLYTFLLKCIRLQLMFSIATTLFI